MIDYEDRPFALGYRDVSQAAPQGVARRSPSPRPLTSRIYQNIPSSVGAPQAQPSPGWSTNNAAAQGGIYQGAGPSAPRSSRGRGTFASPPDLRTPPEAPQLPLHMIPAVTNRAAPFEDGYQPNLSALLPQNEASYSNEGRSVPAPGTSLADQQRAKQNDWVRRAAAERASGTVTDGPMNGVPAPLDARQRALLGRQAPSPAQGMRRSNRTAYDEAGMQRLVDAVQSGAQYGQNQNIGDDTRERARLWLANQG